MPTLTQLQTDATEQLILDAALAVLERTGEITARAAAAEAGISERTVFRYFPSRPDFLAAAAAALGRTLRSPAPPRNLDELRALPRALFAALDEHRELVRAAWHSELRQHMIGTDAKERWQAIRHLLDAAAPRAPERRRKLAAATLRYHLSATTWHYYRFVFRLTLEETVEAAEMVVEQQLAALAVRG
jgi:AcrR family transcriptional regulator